MMANDPDAPTPGSEPTPEPEPVFVCCLRQADRPVSGVEGSTRDVCTLCSAPVWISPATRLVKESRNGRVICLPCASAKAKEAEKEPEVQIDARQLNEIAEGLHKRLHQSWIDFSKEPE